MNGQPPSAGQGEAARFAAVDDTMVADLTTRLIWQLKDTWQMTGRWMNWVQARTFIDEQNRKKLGGFADWRMPTTAEAKGLCDRTSRNKDYMGQPAALHTVFPPGFCFLCWTSEARNKVQAARFGYRKGGTMFDDIYRPSRGATRLVRSFDKEE